MLKKNSLSIIIVNYEVKDELIKCIKSIYDSKPKIGFEIIVVDNSNRDNLSKLLRSKFPKVKYIKSEKNLGYGAGNNLGIKYAKGKYLFILNPDTKILSGKIDDLINFAKKEKNIGLVAPLLINQNDQAYELQGTKELTPKRAIFSLSFLGNIFPRNRIYKEYYNSTWNKKNIKEVDVVPGTAFLIKKSHFEKISGFDEKFFLFFEEFDLCKRIRTLGYKNYIFPDVKIFHEWGSSTKKNEKTEKYFKESRFYYFRKNYGLLKAIFTEILLRINGYSIILGFLLAIGLFLRVFRLDTLMTFISDQGLFYLPARDMVLYGTIPLVGPETSHPWIHHGAHWIYTLAVILWAFNFNPVAPAYFIAILSTFTILVFYLVVKKMFDVRIATLSAIIFTTSPLIVLNSRLPYHTSPIPFFVITLFFLTFKLVKGSPWMLPLITLLLGVLYNHEITNFVYFIAIGLILFYGFIKKEVWFRKLKNVKILITSLVSFTIPMLPFFIYDVSHGYNQTLRFLIWVVYRIVKFPLSLVDPRFKSPGSSPSTIPQFFIYYRDLIYSQNSLIALIILILTVAFIIFYLSKHIKFGGKRFINFDKKIPVSHMLLFVFITVSFAGLSVHRVPIMADTLLFSPFIIILTSMSILWICRNKFYISLIIVLLIASVNVYGILKTDFFTNKNGANIKTISSELAAMDKVIKLADGKPYNIEGKGTLSDYKSFIMPYEYLLWWKGSPPSKENVVQKIVIWEKGNEIIIFKK